MSNLLALLKIEFSKSFSKNSFKENKAKTRSFAAIIGVVVILGIMLSALYTYVYGMIYKEAGLSIFPLTILFASVASALTLFSGINQARGIFIGKDYDLLNALPISKRTIIGAKVINLYLVELLYSSIIMIPHGLVAFSITGEGLVLLTSIILALVVSAFPLVIALIFSFITLAVAAKFKYGNIVSIIFYAIFLGGLMVMSFTISSSTDSAQMANALTNISGIVQWINPAIYFVALAHASNYAYIAIFIAINIASLIIVTLVFALFFDRLHEMVSALKSDYKYVRKELKTKKELKNLLGLEFKRLFSSKMYFMNSCAGLIMAIIMSVLIGLLFMPNSPISNKPEIADFGRTYAYFAGIIIAFGISMSNTCTVGISIEGKNFWLIKSLPINYKKYMWAKILLALILIIPVSLIASTVIVVLVRPSWLSILAIYLIPIVSTFFNVFMGLLINSTFYKLRWSNEQEVVKSSTAVWLSMLVGFLSDIILAALLAVSLKSEMTGVFASIGAGVLASIIVYIALSSSFERKVNSIEDF